MTTNYNRLKYACYATNLSMSIVGNLSPLLFLTFRSLYGISYSLLGLLVLINFFTQLTIDLLFSFFSHKFNITKSVKITPVLTAIGLLIYAIYPFLFPNTVYIGLVIGTLIFSASGGLAEVLISPVIATIPSDDPDREMSKLHSIYAWGVVFIVIFSTLFLRIFGIENWQFLTLICIIIPLISTVLFSGCKIPKMHTPEKASGLLKLLSDKRLILCFLCIFLGGATECIMAQWSSSYLEEALKIPKIWGDVFGVALFAAMLGAGRTLYSKYGKNIHKVLFWGAAGASVCYLTVAISNIVVIGLIACALTGLCVSMLWPGSLIVASDKFPSGGVVIFALMAAGGDLGASVGPQLLGIITDFAIKNQQFVDIAAGMGLSVEQFGMKTGMLFAIIFPIMAVILYGIVWKIQDNTKV